MGDQIISDNLHDHGASTFQDHRNPSSSSAAEDFFEFFRGGLSDYSEEQIMSHAEDIIFCGKLIPINEQLHRKKTPRKSENHHRRNQQNHPLGCRRSRSESRSDVKSTTASALFVGNSWSVGYKKLRRNSSISSEPAAKISRDGSGKKAPSSRWHVLSYGLVNAPPPEMNIRELKNRQVRLTNSKTPIASPETLDALSVSRSVDHRKCSWRVLEFLSCKSSSIAVTMPLGYMTKV